MESQRTAVYTVQKNRQTAVRIEEPEPLADHPPLELGEQNEAVEERQLAGMAGLAVVLGQLVAYFSGRANVDDLDVLSFSLHHLFCRVDFLYQEALPGLSNCMASRSTEQTAVDDLAYRQRVWTQLQKINRTLDRMEPLCHLLSDATECILDAFDATSETEHEVPIQLIDEERWEEGLAALTASLLKWQQYQQELVHFATQFAQIGITLPGVKELDKAFVTLLNCAVVIFGDILPGLRTIVESDETAIAALLLDLMQQSDLLLVQFEETLEPLMTLIKHFAPGVTGE